MSKQLDEQQAEGSRWRMLRDLGVFQMKLLIDGFRDLLLVPASLIAGIASLVTGKNGQPGPQFYQLLEFGKQTELWISLFGALKNAPQDDRPDSGLKEDGVDDMVAKLETFIVDEYKRGGLTAQAKARIDKVFDTLQRDRGR